MSATDNAGKTPVERPKVYQDHASLRAPCAPGERAVRVVRDLAAYPSFSRSAEVGSGSDPALRLLIADDYVDAAESLAMLLSHAGMETAVAFDGEQALARATRWHPHICVLDIDMPKLDGRELARRIRRQSWSERPLLIALTGWTSPHDVSCALEAGFDHYIIKPVEPMKLVRIIQNHLGSRPE